MRLASLAVLMVVACGTEEGSLLTIRAPEGPDSVARLEIVLAHAERIETIDDQRVAPRDFAGREVVRYYRQRATAGEIEAVGRPDGFTVRIEPNITSVPEKHFIPFLVAYDAQANVIGVGAVLGVDGEPTAITIEGGMTRKYFVDMVALKPMDPAIGMAERESMHVVCGDARRWTSGIAWRPAAASPQLRLLLADRSEDEQATDASERHADLDCDRHAADESDCDDLRPAFHAGRQDVCDGMDQNCDGARTAVQACTTSACADPGVQLCDDRTGEPIGACVANSACACERGACTFCALTFRATADAAKQAPCAPAAGKLKLAACVTATCTVEVVSASTPWVGYISTLPTSGFTTKLANVEGEIYVELKLSGTSEVAGQTGSSVGTLHLAITQGAQTTLLPVDIELAETPATTTCQPIAGTNLYPMTCGP